MHYAIATSIVSVIATSSAVASTNVEKGTANMPLGMILECATTLGAIVGGVLAGFLSARVLEGMFAGILVPTAWFMWKGRTEASEVAADNVNDQSSVAVPPPPRNTLDGVVFDEDSGKTIPYHVERLWAGLLVSFFAGNFSGLLGIGGGVFKVPALHILCAVPMKAAAATSNFMIGVTAATGAFFYFGRGEIRPALSATIVLGVLLGSWIGSRLNERLKSRHLRQAFAVLLAIVAVQMAIRSWRSGV